MSESIIVAIILDTLQDLFEWLPIFSEGNIIITLATFGGQPSDAVTLGLFLYHGTAVSVTVYYRITVHELINLGITQLCDGKSDVPLMNYIVTTSVSGVVGTGSYAILEDIVSTLTSGDGIIIMDTLLIIMCGVQRLSVFDRGGSRYCNPPWNHTLRDDDWNATIVRV
jgi:undecaprenyl pyrophosphate phosphatase UppP